MSDSLLCLLTFSSIVQQYKPITSDSKPDNLALIYTFVALLLSAFITYLLEEYRLKRHLRKEFSKLSSTAELAKYTYCLIVLIERSDSSTYRSLLQTVAHQMISATRNNSAHAKAREHLQTFMLMRSVCSLRD